MREGRALAAAFENLPPAIRPPLANAAGAEHGVADPAAHGPVPGSQTLVHLGALHGPPGKVRRHLHHQDRLHCAATASR